MMINAHDFLTICQKLEASMAELYKSFSERLTDDPDGQEFFDNLHEEENIHENQISLIFRLLPQLDKPMHLDESFQTDLRNFEKMVAKAKAKLKEHDSISVIQMAQIAYVLEHGAMETHALTMLCIHNEEILKVVQSLRKDDFVHRNMLEKFIIRRGGTLPKLAKMSCPFHPGVTAKANCDLCGNNICNDCAKKQEDGKIVCPKCMLSISKCRYHPAIKATAECSRCKTNLCDSCSNELYDLVVCKPCYQVLNVSARRGPPVPSPKVRKRAKPVDSFFKLRYLIYVALVVVVAGGSYVIYPKTDYKKEIVEYDVGTHFDVTGTIIDSALDAFYELNKKYPKSMDELIASGLLDKEVAKDGVALFKYTLNTDGNYLLEYINKTGKPENELSFESNGIKL